MQKYIYLAHNHQPRTGATIDARAAAARFLPPAGFWASRFPLAALWIAAALLPAALGCAHAPAPCPTPTGLLDEHRAEVERLDAEVGHARGEERAAKARRDGAAARAAAARAALDSLLAARPPGSTKR